MWVGGWREGSRRGGAGKVGFFKCVFMGQREVRRGEEGRERGFRIFWKVSGWFRRMERKERRSG